MQISLRMQVPYYQVVLTEGGKKSELLNSFVAIKRTMLSMISTEPQINLQKSQLLEAFLLIRNFIVPLKTILPLSNMIGVS